MNLNPGNEEYFCRVCERIHPNWFCCTTSSIPPKAPTQSNPKTLTGRTKLPFLSVIPGPALCYLAMAMRYGAFEAPRKDTENKGYGAYNWRDQPIEASVYIDAALRHLISYFDGEDQEFVYDPESDEMVPVGAPHLAHAMATIAILVDAIENKTVIDDRPKVRSGVASRLIREQTRSG